MNEMSAEHVGGWGCNAACVAGGHFLHADPPDVVTLGENGPYYRLGDMGYTLAVALMRAEAERDHVAAQVAAAVALAEKWAADVDGLPRADGCARQLRAALNPDPSEDA